MMITRRVKTIPADQRTTGFRMNRLKRPRVMFSIFRRRCMIFSIPSRVEGEERLTSTDTTYFPYMLSANIFLVRHDKGRPRVLDRISSGMNWRPSYICFRSSHHPSPLRSRAVIYIVRQVLIGRTRKEGELTPYLFRAGESDWITYFAGQWERRHCKPYTTDASSEFIGSEMNSDDSLSPNHNLPAT